MRNWWHMWESRLSPSLCNDIQNMVTELADSDALVGNRKETASSEGADINEASRRSKIAFLNYSNPQHKVLFDLVFEHAAIANRAAFGFNLEKVIDVQYTKYLASEKGFYNWHEDITWCNDNMFHRKLSFTAQLSDPDSYEGGDFLFDLPEQLCPDQASLRKQGTIIIFPSFLRHKVDPVTKGERHSLVSWIEGLNFR